MRHAVFSLCLVVLCHTAWSQEEAGRVNVRLDDFSDAAHWSSARDAARLESEYVYYRTAALPEAGRAGDGLRWEFKLRDEKQRFSDVYGALRVDEPFERISVWVRNPAKKAISLWLKLVEADGSDYAPTPMGVPIGGTADWQKVEFSFDQYHVPNWSKDENDSLDLPLKNVVIVVHDLNPGEDYQLDVDDLEISRPAPEKVNVVKVTGPAAGTVDVGRDASLQLSLAAGETLRGDYSLFVRLMHDGKPYQAWRVAPPTPTGQWKTGEPVEMPAVTTHFARFAMGGTYEVQARLGWTNLTTEDGKETLMSLEVKPRQPGPAPRAEIRGHNGVPTLFIDGKPNAAMTYMTYNRQEPKYFGDFGKVGVNLATFSATSDFSYYNLAPPTWLAPDVFDYSQFDQRMVSILEANPNAYLFPRVYVSAPPWWCEKYPDEVAKQADETITKGGHYSGTPFAWPGSEKWRQDAGMALRKLIEHVRASPYADRVIGYHIASLHTEEWFHHNFWGNPPSYWGYDKASVAAFRKFLEKRYGTVEALRKAWNDPTVDFAAAAVPSKDDRVKTDLGFFRDPAKSQHVIDFYLYYNDIIVDTIEHFARLVKDVAGRECLFGAFYGYMFELSGSPEGGHLALERLLHCPDVDFLTAPSSYGFRPVGTGCSAFMSLTEAIKLHGKLWFNENDYRTHLVPQKKGVFDYVDLKNLDESVAVQKRELAHTICLGTGMWWFDMGGGWYDTPEFMAAIAEMNVVGEKSIRFDRSSAAEIAVVIDEESMCCRESRGALAGLLLYHQRNQLHRLGAPFDVVLLNDLEKLRPYKLYMFLNTFRLDAKQRAAIDAVVKKDGKTAVWVYAPGFVGDSLSDVGISSVTGITVAHSTEAKPLKITIADVDDDTTKGLTLNAGWGDNAGISPVFFCEDGAAKPLGVLEGIGKTGLAVKRFPNWTSVYCAAPNLPSWLLRSVARAAGVQILNETDDPLYANRSFLALHTNEAGERVLRFAAPTSLYEVFDHKQVARDALEVTVDLPAKHTAFYFRGTEEEWNRAGVK
ncbi:MAG: hypothetical protein A3K19_13265 [Lentisphaerae bacterium RIFOXYB12_FULL_65_16]|nr:MAG: hypothetical protein A3K18_27365 [Lentisphaerae bacterium RIFOXYA12_64_32]OGV87277.1 MAG: hypothetical protein A3K19_13265 [Lentisphaerae bacterium RIFOXYB12_FULL_65_16]